MIRTAMAALGIALCSATASFAGEAEDVRAARTTLEAMFDRPDAPLTVDPIVIAGDYGIADWSQGTMGGRALLRRKGGTWAIALCSGDALKSATALHRIGVPPDTATVLAGKLAEAEKGIDAARLVRLASFEGAVAMDAGSLDTTPLLEQPHPSTSK